MDYVVLFLLAFAAGLIGALQAGPVTRTVLQLSYYGGPARSLPVIIGSILPESLIALLALMLVGYINTDDVGFRIWDYLVTAAALIFGLYYLVYEKTRLSYTESPGNIENVAEGFVMGINQPRHYFYWVAAVTYFQIHNFHIPGRKSIVLFCAGAALGALTLNIIASRLARKAQVKQLVAFNILSLKLFGLLTLVILLPTAYRLISDLGEN